MRQCDGKLDGTKSRNFIFEQLQRVLREQNREKNILDPMIYSKWSTNTNKNVENRNNVFCHIGPIL